MKQKYFLFLISLLGLSLNAQTSTLSYNDDVYTSSYPSVTLNNFSTCQVSASLTASSQGYSGTWADRNYSLIVNGSNLGTFLGTQTIDISSYMPITSVQMNGLYSNWSWVDLTVNITSNNASMPASGPTVTNVTYVQGDTASPLTATLTGTGTTLKWYTDAAGDNYSATGPTPLTTTVGTTSYFVAQANASGCESLRSEIVVTVVANTPATHLNFDGTNDVINFGNSLTTYFTGKTNVTIEAWVRPETNTGLGVIVGNYDYPSLGVGLQMLLRRDNNGYSFWIDGGTGYSSVTANNTVLLNTWQHVVGVWDGTNMKIYVDGSLINTASKTGALPSKTTSFVIGGNAQSVPEMFDGDIDEVRIWDVVRNAEQINGSKNCELVGTESGLKAYYKFNQGVALANNSSETTVTDATANGYNGTLLNSALSGSSSNWLAGSPVTTGSVVPGNASASSPISYNQGDTASALSATTGTNGTGLMWYTSATGGTGSTTAPTPSTATAGSTSYWVASTNANGCESERLEIVVTVTAYATHLNFDGSNDFIVSANAVTTNTQNQTYQAWFRIPSIPTNNDRILQRGSDGTGGWSVQMDVNNAGKLSAGISASPDTFLTGTTTLLPNTWYHATFVFENNNSLRLYLNGALEASVSIGNRTLRNSDNKLRVGTGNIASEYFNGDIDEVRVWNMALSATDILNTYNCELANGETNLVLYYKLNQGYDGANNTSITAAPDSSGNNNNGTLTNFALTGATSNWDAGSTVTTGNTCSTILNNNTFNSNSLVIYPNPTNGILNLNVNETLNVEIFDLLGKSILTKKIENGLQSINISNYPSGIYILKTTNNSGLSNTFKIIKN